ncbi:MAG TPA: hypothetical protein PLU35_00840 [Phycisphaerales bacterium]|nr:hypothetical protein [Phycisphaerales bacterium]
MIGLAAGLALDLTNIAAGWRSAWISRLAAVAFLSGLLLMLRAAWLLRRDLLASGGRLCTRCCHDLTGLPDSGVCPECGTSYDPDTLKHYWGSMAAKRPKGEQSSPPRPIP